MTSRDFCYWLQGYFEIINAGTENPDAPLWLDEGEAACIQKHLAMVFLHEIDPSFPKAQQKPLDFLHNNKDTKARC